MKILIVNPNTSKIFTKRIDVIAQAYAEPSTEITAINPQKGPQSIEGIYDAALSAAGILEAVIPKIYGFDAFVMASYGDHPIIYALREITEKPVISIAEASMHFACMLGYRFSIITSSITWEPLLLSAVQKYGLMDRCASVMAIKLPVLALEAEDQKDIIHEICRVGRIALENDGAEVLCLGSGGMVGLHKRIEDKLNVPVVDGVLAGVKIAESLVSIGLSTSKYGGYAQPKTKPVKGLKPLFSEPYHK